MTLHLFNQGEELVQWLVFGHLLSDYDFELAAVFRVFGADAECGEQIGPGRQEQCLVVRKLLVYYFKPLFDHPVVFRFLMSVSGERCTD